MRMMVAKNESRWAYYPESVMSSDSTTLLTRLLDAVRDQPNITRAQLAESADYKDYTARIDAPLTPEEIIASVWTLPRVPEMCGSASTPSDSYNYAWAYQLMVWVVETIVTSPDITANELAHHANYVGYVEYMRKHKATALTASEIIKQIRSISA
jgi:hypothetical protein